MARGKTDYDTMTVEELHEEARRRGITGTSKMRKEELIETIRGDSDESSRGGGEPRGDSKSVKYSQHVRSVDEHEEYEGRSLITRDHDVIRRWAEERKATPATIRATEHGGRPGVLRLNFPGYAEGGNLEEISWDAWFGTFEARGLNFIYQEHTVDGKQSNFFRLDNPDREDG